MRCQTGFVLLFDYLYRRLMELFGSDTNVCAAGRKKRDTEREGEKHKTIKCYRQVIFFTVKPVASGMVSVRRNTTSLIYWPKLEQIQHLFMA